MAADSRWLAARSLPSWHVRPTLCGGLGNWSPTVRPITITLDGSETRSKPGSSTYISA